MLNTRSKITAGAATLVTGAGLAVALLTGNAGAATPAPSAGTIPAGVVITQSVPCGATALAIDPEAARPTATVMASASAAAPQDTDSDAAAAAGGVCSDTAAFQPGAAATAPGK